MLGFFSIKYTYFLLCLELGSSPAGYSTARSGIVSHYCFLFPWHNSFGNVFMDALEILLQFHPSAKLGGMRAGDPYQF